MFDYEAAFIGSKLIKDEALYIGIFDESSPVNIPNKWDELFRKSEKDAGRESWQSLFYFNGEWIRLAEKGEILSWITLFDGVFKIELRLLSAQPQIDFKKEEKEKFLGNGEFNRLFCPSGKIVAASLGDLGTNLIAPLAEIEPGWYKVAFNCSEELESDHYFLGGIAEYPAQGGSDWIIYLQKEL